jgi:hypothetical protein
VSITFAVQRRNHYTCQWRRIGRGWYVLLLGPFSAVLAPALGAR